MRRALLWGRLGALVAAAGAAALATPVAAQVAEYADLYALLTDRIAAFDHTLDQRSGGAGHAVSFAGELLTANGNRGRALLTPQALAGVRLELDRLRALGLDAVTIAIPFPILDPDFLAWSSRSDDRQAFVSFFATVVSEAHARGMKLIAENGAMFPGVYSAGSGLDAASYYPLLTANQYIAGRTAQAVTIARDIRPDLLNVGSEPDTEAHLTGQSFLRSPTSFAGMVRGFVTAVAAAGASEVPMVAGSGSWMVGSTAFVSSLCAIPGLWGIDLHVYPVNGSFLDQALALADLARTSGKHVVLLEAWLQKERDSELTTIDAAFDPTLFARDAFSFWGPLDRRFLAVMVKLARVAGIEVLSPFWTRYFFAYLDYDQLAAAPTFPTPEQIVALATAAHAQALVAGRYTDTGRAYLELIRAPRVRGRLQTR